MKNVLTVTLVLLVALLVLGGCAPIEYPVEELEEEEMTILPPPLPEDAYPEEEPSEKNKLIPPPLPEE